MSWLFKAAATSIGKKQCVAITGLLLCLYLLLHLVGNLFLFAGPETYNGYAKALEENPLLLPAEIALLLLFVFHIYFALRVTAENRRARPVSYVIEASEGTRTLASSTMWISGLITLVFLGIHLYNFRFPDERRHDLYRLVVTTFQNPAYAAWYLFAVVVLGLHVGHGLQSAFRSLGVMHPVYTRIIKWSSRIFGVVVAAGYGCLPVWAYFFTRSGTP